MEEPGIGRTEVIPSEEGIRGDRMIDAAKRSKGMNQQEAESCTGPVEGWRMVVDLHRERHKKQNDLTGLETLEGSS